jgi:hypothetical protein
MLCSFGWIVWEALFSWYVLCNSTTLAPRMTAKVRFPSSSFHGMGCGLDIRKEAPHKILASHAPRNKAPARRQGDRNTMRSRIVLVVRRGWLNNERTPENTADAEVDDSGMKEVIRVSRSIASDLIEEMFQAISSLRNELRRNKTKRGIAPWGAALALVRRGCPSSLRDWSSTCCLIGWD